MSNSSSARPPRAAIASPLLSDGDSSRNRAIRSLNCSPPAGNATSSVELHSAAWSGGELRDSESRKSNNPFTPQFCRVRAAASGPGIEDAPPQARRFYEPQKHAQQLGPARRENRLRFSRLKNKHSPKHRLVSASLRLRCRSAAIFARLRDSVYSARRRNS